MGEILDKLEQIKKQGALEEFLNRLTPEEKQRLNQRIDEELAQEQKQQEPKNKEEDGGQQTTHPILNKVKELGTSAYTGALEGATDFNKLFAGLIPFQKPKNWFLQTFVNPYEQQIQQERQAHPGFMNELARQMGNMGVTTPLDIMTGGATREALLAGKYAPKTAQILSKAPSFALGMGLRKGVERYQQAQPGVGSKLGGALTGAAQGLGEGLAYHKAGELPLKFRLPTMGAMGAGFGAMGEMEQGKMPSLETAKQGAIQGVAQEAILSLLGGLGGRVRNKADRNAHARIENIVKEYVENPEKAMPKLEKTLKAIEGSKNISEDYKAAIKQSNLPAILTGKYPVKVETPKVIKVKTIKEEGAIPGAEGKVEIKGKSEQAEIKGKPETSAISGTEGKIEIEEKPKQTEIKGKPKTSAIIDETVNKKVLPPAPIPIPERQATSTPIPMPGETKPIPLSGEVKNTERIYDKEREVSRMPDGSFAMTNEEDARELGYNGYLKREDWNKLEKYKEKIDKAYNHLVKKLDIKPPQYLEEDIKKMAISHSLSDNSEFKGKPLQALKFAFDREYKNFLEGKSKRVEQLENFAKVRLSKKQLEDNLKKGEKVNPENLKNFPSLADKYNYDYETGLPKRKAIKEEDIIKTFGFYKSKNKNEWIYVRGKQGKDKYKVTFVDINVKPSGKVDYSEDYDVVSEEELKNLIKHKKPYVAYKNKKRNVFYAIWDGANKKNFKYILPKHIVEDLGLKKHNFPEQYYKEKQEFKPKDVWEMTKEEFLDETPKGYKYDSKMSHEAMVNEKGQIVLGKKFFELPKNERKSIIAHEMAHKSGIEEKALKDPKFWRMLQEEKMYGELHPETGEILRGINGHYKPSENLVESYKLLFEDPEWLKKNYPKAYEYVVKLAKREKLPLPEDLEKEPKKSEFYDGQPIASDKHGKFVIKKKNGKLSIYYQMESQDTPDSLAVGFHEDIKDAIKRLRQILPNVFKGDEYSYVNPEIKKALKEVEAEESAKEEKKKQEEEILRKKINKVRNFWHDLDKVKLKFKKHTVELDSGVKVNGWKRGQWFIYKIKGSNKYSILHLPNMKSLIEQPSLADAKRVVKLIEMAGLDKKKNFNNLDLEILKDINRISKLNEKSIDSFEAIKDMLLKKDKMRQTLNYFLDSHIPSFKKTTFMSKDGEKRNGMAYKDWAIEKAQLKDGTVFYRIFHLPSGFMVETFDTLKDAKRAIAVYDLMGLDRFKFKDRKDVTKEIIEMYRDAGCLATLSEKADIRGELEEFDKKYHILEKMGVTTKLYAGIPIHEVFKAFKEFKKEAKEKYYEMTGIDEVIDKDLKLWEKIFKTPQWLAKKYKSIKKILDLEDLKTYTKITKYSDYLRRLEDGEELLLSKMSKKEEQAFSDILIALDKYNNSIVKTEREHGIYKFGKISPFAKEIIDSILDQHNLSQKERDRVWRLYQNFFDVAHEIRRELIETLKQTKDKDLIDKYMKEVGYVKYYFPRLRESGNTAIRVYDKDGNLVHLEFTDTLLKGKSPKAHLKTLRETRKLYPKEDGYRIRISKNVKGEELDHFNEFLNVAMVKDILESITDKDNEELKKIYAQKLADLFKSRGFLSHAIKRREDYITGFEDERVVDVIKKFLAGYSGFAGKKKFVEKLIEEKPKIDRANINERKAANQMIKHLLRNENNADRISARIKSLLFMKYIAGKVSTPILNLTQTAITTAPTLGKELGDLPKAYKIVAKNTSKALKLTMDILKNKPHIFFTSDKKPSYLTREEWETIKKAYEHGDLSSKLAQDFRGKIEGAFRGKLADILIDKPAMLMDVTETYNRVLALLSGYEGLRDANKARELMKKTQFDYSKANIPIVFMGEGNTGAMLRSFYTFRRYGHNLLQLWGELAKEDKKAFLASLSTVTSIGGVTALPLVDWIFNELAKKTGKDYKKEIEQYLNDAIGSKLTDIFMRGLPTLIGIDMSGQAGVDIPFFSSYNNSKNLLTYLFKELSGASGQTILDAQKAVDYIMRGQYKKALELITPAYVSYPMKAQRLAYEGVTKADNSPILVRGEDKTIKPLKLTKKEAIMKAMGFQPSRLNKVYEARESIKNIEEYFKNKKQNIYNKLRAYAYLKKGDRKEIMRQIVNYNKELYKKSPELYKSMRITRRSIKQAIRLNLRPEDKILLMRGVK